MSIFRYSEWDGTQDIFDLNADDLMDELGRNMMSTGDLSYALRMLQRGGIRDSQGRRLPSIQEMLQRLRQRKQDQLDKYKLSSVMDEIREKLDDVINTERQGIEKIMQDARHKAGESVSDVDPEIQQKLLQTVEGRAAHNLAALDQLPEDVGGKIKELTDYDFMDEEARRKFQELIDMLKKHAMESYGREMIQQIKQMDPSALAGLRHMIEALNQMLEQRRRGEEVDFEGFMSQFGNFFGPEPPQSLDELIERMQQQIAQAQSLMNSLSPRDRQELQELLQSMLDDATQYELAKLANNLEALYPSDDLRQRYPFSGEEPISYSEALRLMESLQKMDRLETQFKESQYRRSLDSVDEQLVQELMGREAAEELERLRSITRVLEEAGYIRLKDGRYELTPRGMRKIGQKALEDIFAQLRKDRSGGHNLRLRGGGGEKAYETKKYQFGDDFQVHLERTIMNSIQREPSKPPVKLDVSDFEVYQSEAITRSATVIVLDLSLSMPMRGNFEAAKRVAIALDNLIRTQYPKDSLHIVGFSSYARRVKKEDLNYMTWDEFDPYTNMQQGLALARRTLSKEICNNKQILLITDGEPTAHIENGRFFFQMPPSLRTVQLTLREVNNCTRKGIVINTFMLDSGRQFLSAFVTQMARINKGRIFFTNADSLGQYLMVDYIANKKRKI